MLANDRVPAANAEVGGTIANMGNSPTPVPSFGAGPANQEESGPPIVPIAIGAVAVLIIVALFVFLGRRDANENVPPAAVDPYAANLAISGVTMSTAANFAGQEVTYIEGKITNRGSKAVTNALMQIVFRDALGQVVQREPAQRMMVITTREPYVDTASLSSAPLKPEQTREFRQTFEHVSADWNRQLPEITILKTSTE